MSDFESRLSDALSSGAEGAPTAAGLAERARRRARRRRRTTLGVAAAAVVAGVAVPVSVVALRDAGSAGTDAAHDPAPTSPGAAGDTRIETWHDLQVEVPASWGHGPRSTWCIGGDAETPVVERPGGVVASIACSPRYGHGVVFGQRPAASLAHPSGQVWRYDSGDDYAPGTWLGYWYDDNDLVQVAAGDKETVEEVIGSVQVVGSVDGNGCPVADEGGAGGGADDEVSVCRYSAEGDLEQSERLTGDDAAAARAAVEGATENPRGHLCKNGPEPYVVMTVDGARADVKYAGHLCVDRGLFVGDQRRELTEDVLYWALSPGWSGSVESWVPLPPKLRVLPAAQRTEPPVGEFPCPDGFFANSDFALDPDNGEPMTVCRMELTYQGESGGTLLLADTTELPDEESDAVRAAVAAAPVMEESDVRQCSTGPGEFFLVLAGDAVPLWVYNAQCGELAALTRSPDGDVVYHRVTDELLDALGSPHGLLR
jgi:hypothetical protein